MLCHMPPRPRKPIPPPVPLPDGDELLLPEEVAAMLRVPPRTLLGWRTRLTHDGGVQGPPWIRLEGGVRYRRSKVEQWLEENEQQLPFGRDRAS
jgi:hypothetical protein